MNPALCIGCAEDLARGSLYYMLIMAEICTMARCGQPYSYCSEDIDLEHKNALWAIEHVLGQIKSCDVGDSIIRLLPNAHFDQDSQCYCLNLCNLALSE
jgi:hypothetical protein